ncbi:MAG: DUF1569 domain-containing protein [Acidobacteria bacterium]|nr:DUF1569 domain-containing protein [Acidobacteriota bacterium]
MQTLFDASGRQSVVERLDRLTPSSSRQWGKMDVAQMMAHCSAALAVATGDTPRKQALIGRIFAPFVKASLLGEKPFSRNSPTDPTFVVTDQKDFAREKERLTGLIGRFAERGPELAGAQIHSFLGRLRGDEWGVMMYKHLDHHLKQFGA